MDAHINLGIINKNLTIKILISLKNCKRKVETNILNKKIFIKNT